VINLRKYEVIRNTMSQIELQDFLSNLTTIPEPSDKKLNANHFREPYHDFERLTNSFNQDIDEEILCSMFSKGEDHVDFIRHVLNMSQPEFSKELNDFTQYSSFDAQVPDLVEHARNTSLTGSGNKAREFSNYLISKYGLKFKREITLANKDITHEKLLEERYIEKRRSALEGQQHGKYVENGVEKILTNCGLILNEDYHKDSLPPVGDSDKDVDFVIPELKLLIECKGYVTGGSKINSAVGDIDKVNCPDDWNFLFVFDGDVLEENPTLLDKFISFLDTDVIHGTYQLCDLDLLNEQIRDLQSGNQVAFLKKSKSEIQSNLSKIPTEELELPDLDEALSAFKILQEIYDCDNSVDTLTKALSCEPKIIHILRLILDLSEGRFATELHPYINSTETQNPGYDKIIDLVEKTSGNKYCSSISTGLHKNQDIKQEINSFLIGDVNYFNIISNRYVQKTGIAMKSRHSGDQLENKIENLLNGLGYEENNHYFRDKCAEFTNNDEIVKTSKSPDFVIPRLQNPKIIIEAKACNSDGSTQTDVLGDIKPQIVDKIPKKSRKNVKVFLFTDGNGWKLRTPDLEQIIDYHNDGIIDGLFQISTLNRLEEEITNTIAEPESKQVGLDTYGSN